MLKRLRIIIAVILFALITAFFLDFAGVLPNQFHVLAHLQFVSALLSLSFGILAFLIILTLLFGRIYCSTICPMGVFQDAVGRVSAPFKSKKQKRFKYSPARTILRWSIVALCVVTFALGLSFVVGLLDPYSAYGRMVVNVFQPIYLAGNNLLESIFTRFDNYTFYKVEISILSISSFIIGILTFLVIGFLAWRNGRIWCNTMCPVGTILGLLGKFSLFKVRINEHNCTKCGRCARSCKSSCIDVKTYTVDTSRCVACYNCLGECRDNAISYSLPKKRVTQENIDDSKRRFFTAGITTAAVASATAVQAKVNNVLGTETGVNYQKTNPITPPGSISRKHLLSHCTSCHLCVSKCPANIIKPAFLEYGLGGIMQPTISFEKGFCNYDCTICGEVCPNGAILPQTIEEKHRTQMGYVVFVLEDCIVYKDETSCGACSEHCPTQALSMVPYKDSLTIPKVDTDICVGCGGCEYVCPTTPRAVHIEGNPVHKEALPFHDPEDNDVEIDGFGF